MSSPGRSGVPDATIPPSSGSFGESTMRIIPDSGLSRCNDCNDCRGARSGLEAVPEPPGDRGVHRGPLPGRQNLFENP